jgi:coenzyme F420-0:L-glutamate ligase/coenzyme F420-1:gamma-L-glutamate ligase
VVIVEHNNGYVHANAGIDASNIENNTSRVLLLPENPDRSARELRDYFQQHLGINVAVIINDSFGRAWRNGTCGVCIGSAGFEVIDDRIGDKDLFGQELKVTQSAVADEIAAAASLLMGQADEATPVVVITGLHLEASDQGSTALIRSKEDDLFR